ncbi:CLUMA_CG009592, isoform A [Clunio marinus]|uniref:CLUMA_CG009592, isoform A n=1 Tax=Clunio marinus TaxID=568069 RepID=A0A1J1I7K0_9DIPT|nr:CLUMA_CG009592, isoform A [Clunio marinus]
MDKQFASGSVSMSGTFKRLYASSKQSLNTKAPLKSHNFLLINSHFVSLHLAHQDHCGKILEIIKVPSHR